MRVLHIISTMQPEGGGPQEAVRMLLRNAPPGCSGEVLTLDDPSASFLAEETFTIHPLGPARGSYSALLMPWLRANRARFDGVVLHGMWEYLSYAVLRAVAGHTPYLVYPHGMLDPYFKRAYPLKHLKKWLYWLPVQYWTLRCAHRVVFTTNAERDLGAQSFWLHRWRAAVIALGSAPPTQGASECEEAFFAQCPQVRGVRYLLFLGRLDRKKGCDLLLEAFAEQTSRDGEPTLHLVMAGPDSTAWRAALQALAERKGIAQRVHWPGMLTGAAKWGAFAACEAFVLPSHQENFGIAVVEALTCGKPVLITRAINIAADLEADGCALVEDDTLEGTKRLLSRWLALTAEERAAMAVAACNTVATRYDMRRNADELIGLLMPDVTHETSLAEVRNA